jgi:hypothetical protein
MKPQVAAPTTVLTVLELTSQPSQTVVAPTPADLHSATTATERSSPTVLRPSGAATTPTAAAATAEAPTMEPTGGLVAVAVAVAEATGTATPLAPHRAAMTLARRLRSCGGRSRPP